MGTEPILFIIFGILALGAAVCVVVFKNPIHSVLALMLTFFSLAGLFVLLGAYFVAAVQVIVYAG
ncbi:MAG: NADH-quinone oxidoreductase subunit J, partial [Candidatus Poribacteria bacterium]|nr:NADH-quinone oxidoreductase subunit J [Candidatus Poribacteria bacterium]